ncbi:hypothetical protein HK104_010442 [Borealophlyctis nickersoniae]|nr:hypothetical protein HK104_010442 [Borealophlyctis nickersoniae]
MFFNLTSGVPSSSPPREFELGYLITFKESPTRAENILAAVQSRGVGQVVRPVDHGLAPIVAVHTREYVEYLKTAYEKWIDIGGNPDGIFPDCAPVREFENRRKWGEDKKKGDGSQTKSKFPYAKDGGDLGRPGYFCFDMTGVIAEGTYKAAYDAAQVALTGADILMNEAERGVFALCRPPGHHAHKDLCAIAVRHLIDTHRVGRVAILDIDYHHGNGTQELFYEANNPLYVSLHAAVSYPYYWGSEDETGHSTGEGFNVNVPLKLGTQDEEYLDALKGVIDGAIRAFKPDALVVSLGVDTFKDDPIGGFFLTTECYTDIGRAIASVGVPTLFVMEGGYNVGKIGENVTNVLLGFDGK